jgi:hypothetical protein
MAAYAAIRACVDGVMPASSAGARFWWSPAGWAAGGGGGCAGAATTSCLAPGLCDDQHCVRVVKLVLVGLIGSVVSMDLHASGSCATLEPADDSPTMMDAPGLKEFISVDRGRSY